MGMGNPYSINLDKILANSESDLDWVKIGTPNLSPNTDFTLSPAHANKVRSNTSMHKKHPLTLD